MYLVLTFCKGELAKRTKLRLLKPTLTILIVWEPTPGTENWDDLKIGSRTRASQFIEYKGNLKYTKEKSSKSLFFYSFLY
jgi:hypothetical protein